ncbi:MAG: 16S rRNA (cytosine(1402)-N(4))-methyltransferase [bacterium]|nr:16S rRNA (cytosine(1402)-N(4))-methyltransferase [bacterium]
MALDLNTQSLGRTDRILHQPIFLQEILKSLVQPKARYVDGTLGDGGHAKALLTASDESSKLIGIDLDTEGQVRAKKELVAFGDRVLFAHNTFANVDEVVKQVGWGFATGILFDLGMSTHHLQAERGFSFKNQGALDMQFDPTGTIALPEPTAIYLKRIARKIPAYTAKDLLNNLHEDELAELIQSYGEEAFSERIAAGIVQERRNGDIDSVPQLVQIVLRAYPGGKRHGRIHIATKTFQALRIAVNREYETLQIAIKKSLAILADGGRLAIISFHSGEDRIVKQVFRQAAQSENFTLLTKHPIKPTFQEVRANAWSRSAKLRILEKSK